MFNIVDIIGIIIVLICAFIAFKKGFVKTFFGFISTFVAIILAFTLCNTGVMIIKQNTDIDEWIENTLTVSLKIEQKEEISGDSNEEPTVSDEDNKNILENVFENLPENIQSMVGFEEYKENTKKTIVASATEVILKILSWIIIYVLVRLLLLVVCLICNGIMNIAFLKQINNLAGLILGVILGLFRVYIILAVISFLVAVVPLEGVVELIKSSMIISLMYENNILISLIF